MKKSTFCAITLAIIPGVSAADTIFGIYAGAGSWQSEFSGTLNTFSAADINVGSDLGINDDTNNMLWVAIEHPLPLIPNIKLKSTALEINGTNALAQNISFNNVTIANGTTVVTDLDLTHTDATFYYEILDNWISIDLGLTLRQFDGDLMLTTASRITIDETIALADAMGQFELPFSGFYGGFEANAIGLGDSNVTDVTLKVGYESDLRIGAELGYRIINVTLDDVANLDTDIEISGIYVAVTLHI
ncbi:MAG: TIGR04219 family outer membrane beta-barrel protein [Pseudomonadales bacterium]|nr:TIGR04219 family outer membrane beta-barrel protein [Pseudomonadales bacterium]